jgi:uncharacterized membrane protein YheB (UPF0754 family)
MWKKIKDAVMDWVNWAERELRDKTGAEKRKAVIEKLVEVIDIPFVPDLFESPIERIVYGYLIDRACAWFNVLGDGNFETLVLTEEQKEKIAEMIETVPAEIISTEAIAGASVDDKLNALYSKYTEK